MATAPEAILKVVRTDIELPISGLDYEAISNMMDQQEHLARYEGGGVVHTEMSAKDHPNRSLIEMSMIEEGYEECDIEVTSLISHTVANSLRGLPELIVANACPDSAGQLIEEVEGALASDEGLVLDYPVLLNGRLIQLVSVKFKQLSLFEGAYESFAAMQILMAQQDIEPRWLQIVYADQYHRFPWEPGADRNLFQPVPRRGKYPVNASRLLN